MEPLYGPRIEAQQLRKQRAEEQRRDRFFRSKPLKRKLSSRRRGR